MKKLTTIFTALTLFLATTAFAGPIDLNREVQNAFTKNFAGATNVTWEETDDFYFASFELKGKNIKAAFNEQGELLGLSRKLTLAEIPLNVSQALKTDFATYKIEDMVTEIVFEGQTFYYASALGEKRNLTLKCFSDGQIFIEKRMKK